MSVDTEVRVEWTPLLLHTVSGALEEEVDLSPGPSDALPWSWLDLTRPQPQIWSKTRVRGRQWVTAGMWFKGHCRWRKWLCGGGGGLNVHNNTWPDTDGCSRYRTWRHCFSITPFNRFDFVTLFFIKQHHDFIFYFYAPLIVFTLYSPLVCADTLKFGLFWLNNNKVRSFHV